MDMLYGHGRGFRKAIAMIAIRVSIRCFLAGVHVSNMPEMSRMPGKPILFYANHVSQWDSQICLLLSHSVLKYDTYLMGAEYVVTRLATWAGVFSVDTDDPLDALES